MGDGGGRGGGRNESKMLFPSPPPRTTARQPAGASVGTVLTVGSNLRENNFGHQEF
jgi:hypothetical protein